MRDPQQPVPFGAQEADDRLPVTRLGAPHERSEPGMPANRVEPRIPCERWKAEEATVDDVVEQGDGLVVFTALGQRAGEIVTPFGIRNVTEVDQHFDRPLALTAELVLKGGDEAGQASGRILNRGE